MNYTEIDQCRISGSKNLVEVLDLGTQSLTGVFPSSKQAKVTEGPLKLVLCPDSQLLQLKHNYDLSELYGDNYGYRSGLNLSMVNHLNNKVNELKKLTSISKNDIVLDIGSNDGTLLKSYKIDECIRVGIDPTGKKFKDYYDDIHLIPDFFSSKKFQDIFPNKKAKVITSISMLYDLESPIAFIKDVAQILDHDGIWHFEQSYMPTMLRMNLYDTICHEHLEYYSLTVIKNALEQCGLKIIDVSLNSINGGSFAVTASHMDSKLKTNEAVINWMLDDEKRLELETTKPYLDFARRVLEHKTKLKKLIDDLNNDGKKIMGYGASTKGNVLLQYCNFNSNDISHIGEINTDKFGSFTPGSKIPIVSEAEVKSMKPDYLLVLPWHFRDGIINKEKDYLASGGKFIFPMPEIEIF
jgi:hypothetical protein